MTPPPAQTFMDTMAEYPPDRVRALLASRTERDVHRALTADRLTPVDFLALLSDVADPHIEAMAQRSRQLTIQYFGRIIQLYIPLYISNYCSSECIYCGFSRSNRIHRQKLSLDEIDTEARSIAATGMRHILVLTGESPKITPIDYLLDVMAVLKTHFASISIEMFPMDTDDYQRLKIAGVDGLTLYQEVYDPVIYGQVHLAGEKTDYRYRIDAPQRGAEAGFRSVNIGALLGLADPRLEAFYTGLHARFLTDRYLDTEISISMPRINPAEGGYQPAFPVNDRLFVRTLTAFRMFLPRAGIPISTRERSALRDRLMHMGATRFSAGSRTDVGGYDHGDGEADQQFAISDERSVADIVAAIQANGMQPVHKDWEYF